MKRTFRSFPVTDIDTTKLQMLSWANQFNICCFLDNHQYKIPGNAFECVLAVNHLHIIQPSPGRALTDLHDFLHKHNDWIFGHIGYDVKNELENLQSGNPDHIQFPDLCFFIPEILVILKEDELLIGIQGEEHAHIAEIILGQPLYKKEPVGYRGKIETRFSKEEYIQTVNTIKAHILRGDCYELNFCQEFYCENISIDPLSLYLTLSEESPNPFSCYYRLNDKYLLCASPERYIKKTGSAIISQPIKGTIRRSLTDADADRHNRNVLFNSGKDRSENVMVVDLVRNDLSKICEKGTVVVEELFGIYPFPQVYQMISTVKGEVPAGINAADIFKATFPMGSMTGAPKKRAMELIDRYEHTKRGLFSGSIGYISAGNDMDFNVVIRSILYNGAAQYLSFQTGSAITYYCNAESEYEECLLKAAAIKKVLNQ